MLMLEISLPYPARRFILRNSSDASSNATSYQLPMECPSNNEPSGRSRPCTGSNFIPQQGQGCTVYTNHQELRVQEQMQCLEPGSVPASIAVTVQDELADCCQPGGTLCCAVLCCGCAVVICGGLAQAN